MNTLLDVKDLSISFRTYRGVLEAIHGVSLTVGAGETIGIVGESGCGKSVTAQAVMGVKALDDRTLVVRLHSPTAYFLNLTAFHCYYPVPRHVVEERPDTWASDAEGLVSNGPFKITKWIHSSEIVMNNLQSRLMITRPALLT